MSLEIDYRARKLTKEEIARRNELAGQEMKVCCKCRRELPYARFSRLKSTRDGLAVQCKDCAARYYQRAKRLYTFVSADFSALKAAAEKRGIAFELSADGLRHWWGNVPEVCVYCNQSVEEVAQAAGRIFGLAESSRFFNNLSSRLRWSYKQKNPVRRLSVDRKDNEGPYSLGNIQKACFICNYLKGSILTDEEMDYLAPRLWARIHAAIRATGGSEG